MKKYPKKELFFDDREIEAVENLKKTMNKPCPASDGPVMVADQPWEGSSISQSYVIYDTLQNKFRMWYRGYYQSADTQPVRGWAGPALRGTGYSCTTCYAESDDGFEWKKPSLGRVEFNGSKDNNLAIQGWCSADLASMIFQPNHPVPEKRYRLYVWDDLATPERHSIIGMTTYVSSDGIDWKGYGWPNEWCSDPQPFCYVKHVGNYRYPYSIGPGECNSIFYDEKIGKYVNYCRCNNGSVRSVGRMESEDGIHWTPPVLVLSPDLKDPFRLQIYSVNAMRCGEFVLLMIHLYHMQDLTIDVQLAASRDGYNFTRVADREVFMDRGTAGLLYPATPFEHNGELWIYASLSKHAYGVDDNPTDLMLYKMRPDGFVSFDAVDGEGSLVTRRMVWEHDELEVNADAKNGEFRVEIMDGNYNVEGGNTFDEVYKGRGIEGFTGEDCVPLTEDSLNHKVTFKNKDISELKGKYVQLRFYIKNAKFYSWEVK
jgi:hypothetical protein